MDKGLLGLLKNSEAGEWVGKPTVLAAHPWATIVEQKFRFRNGLTQLRTVHLDWGGVGILALTDRREVVLLDLPRLPIGEAHFLEIPGGGVQAGKTLLEKAQEELLEETGLVAEKWFPLFAFPRMPHFSTCWHMLFMATEVRKAGAEELAAVTPDKNEIINQVVFMPLAKAFTEIGRRITEPATVIALQWLKIRELEGN